ncbi:MAG: holo-ACP synthase [Acidobacteriota bacterium]|jgi:holo-[acyl-carrier protein] synthase
MILGLGIDLVRIERLRKAVKRHPAILDRLFTPGEQEMCLSRKDSDSSLAARFAAKEAFLKAVGTGWGRGMKWTDIEVAGGGGQAPSLVLHGEAEVLVRRMGAGAGHLSLAHDGGVACAVVVLEKESAEDRF